MTITTTLNRIAAHDPCSNGWRKLLNGLGKTKADDEVLAYTRIVEINGIDDALWACRVEPQHAKEWRLFAVWCARQVEHLMHDPRSVAAINVASGAPGMAALAALAATAAARAALDASIFARAARDAAALAAAWDAAALAALAATAAAWDAAAARDAQTAKFLEIVGE